MNEEKFVIHIPGRRKSPLKDQQQPLVRLTEEAYNVIVDIYNDSYLSMGKIVSEIIMQAKDHIVFSKE